MSLLPDIIDKVFELIRLKLSGLKLEAQAQIAYVLAKIITFCLILMMLTLCLLFFSIALAMYLNSIWESAFLGFLAVGLAYALLLIVGVILVKSDKFAVALESAILNMGKNYRE